MSEPPTRDPLTAAASFWLDAKARASSRALVAVHLVLVFGSVAWAAGRARETVRPLLEGREAPPVARDEGETRFGLPLAKRKAIFAEIAAAEPQAILNGKTSFPGKELEWSAEDHRGAYERQTVAAMVLKYGVTTTQVYLCLDEGIRQQWPGADGKPLNPHTVPLHPRRKYGW
jgi:hypothetical protein